MTDQTHQSLTEPRFPSYLLKRYKSFKCKRGVEAVLFVFSEIWLICSTFPVIILDAIYALIYRCLAHLKSGKYLKHLTPKLAIHSRKYRKLRFYCFLEDLKSNYKNKDDDITDENYAEFVNDMLSSNGAVGDRDDHIGLELFYLCKKNHKNKLKYILIKAKQYIDVCSYQCEFYESSGWKIQPKTKDPDEKMTLMHVALLRGSFEAAMELINLLPPIKIKSMLSSTGLHNTTSLHLAILQQHADVVDKILSCLDADELKNILYIRSKTRSLRCSSEGAQLPLSLAVLSGNVDIVDALINAKVNLSEQDSFGYNIFHTLVLQSLENLDDALLMYDKIVNYVPDWWEQTAEEAAIKCTLDTPKLEAMSCLFKQKTKSGNLTPLGLAAYLGASAMLEKILNTDDAYRFKLMEFGKTDLVCYDISEIDTVIDVDKSVPSILEILVGAKTDEALKSMDIPVIDKIITEKWNNYFMYYFMVWALYVSFAIVFTATLGNHLDFDTNNTSSQLLDWLNHDTMTSSFLGIFLILCLLYYLILGLSILFPVLADIARRHFSKIAFNLAWRRLIVAVVMLLVSSAGLLGFVFRFGDGTFQKICVIFVALSSWLAMLFHMQGFKPTAIFSLMLERILFRDMLLFAVGYICIAIGYGIAFWVNMNFFSDPPDNYRQASLAIFSVFRMMVGSIDTDELFDRNKFTTATYVINVILFIGYISMSTILLLNMLIARMTYTYDVIRSTGGLWKKLRQYNTQMIEVVLPSWVLLYCSNYPTKTYTLREYIDGEWKTYERVIHFYKV